MIAFEPTEEQKLMAESVTRFAERTLRPRMREFERARAVPPDVLDLADSMGLPFAAFPTEFGGGGLGAVSLTLIEEALAHGDPAVPFALRGPGAYGWAALLFGGPARKRLIAPFAAEKERYGAVAWGEAKAPPDRLGLSTMATRTDRGWHLTGEKCFVQYADRASDFIVFAQIDASKGWDGIGAFAVPKEAVGLRVLPRHETLGLDAASFAALAFEELSLPEEAHLPQSGDPRRVVAFFATQGLAVAARCVGLAQAAFDVARDYCQQRKAFGKPIGHFQAVAFTLADRAMDIEAARSMVWRAAWLWDQVAQGAAGADERDALLHTAWAVSFAKTAAMKTADDAVQLHGGAGFMRDVPVEKWMRDAKQMQLCAMTAEQADQLAAALALGLPIDPEMVLPGPSGQNVFI